MCLRRQQLTGEGVLQYVAVLVVRVVQLLGHGLVVLHGELALVGLCRGH